MDYLHIALTAVHLLAAIAWLGGMIFHIYVLDPVFRKSEVTFQSAILLALMEQRFRNWSERRSLCLSAAERRRHISCSVLSTLCGRHP
ncbi:MAG: hypothetical protein HW377_1990, partial [Actinobacteria bacterium]|nr:hypothetical protein [Actinomycetota bacterium]